MRAPAGVDILRGVCDHLVHLRIEDDTMPQELHMTQRDLATKTSQ